MVRLAQLMKSVIAKQIDVFSAVKEQLMFRSRWGRVSPINETFRNVNMIKVNVQQI